MAHEFAAYEALWLSPDTTTAELSRVFRSRPGILPSDLVSSEEIRHACARLATIEPPGSGRALRFEISSSPGYPAGLRDAEHLVPAIYLRGDRALLESGPRVSVIGSREASAAGIARAQRLARELASAGITVVSGLARGIDAAAHGAAMQQGGRTVAVLGTSVLDVYPAEHRNLQETIGEHHLLVSQVPVLRSRSGDWRDNRSFFAERNATMSALTHATVIVEAQERSGTLVQARAALRQGRALYVLESCFADRTLAWPDRVLQAGGTRLRSASQLLDDLRPPALLPRCDGDPAPRDHGP